MELSKSSRVCEQVRGQWDEVGKSGWREPRMWRPEWLGGGEAPMIALWVAC
jgi:hypothetical protein